MEEEEKYEDDESLLICARCSCEKATRPLVSFRFSPCCGYTICSECLTRRFASTCEECKQPTRILRENDFDKSPLHIQLYAREAAMREMVNRHYEDVIEKAVAEGDTDRLNDLYEKREEVIRVRVYGVDEFNPHKPCPNELPPLPDPEDLKPEDLPPISKWASLYTRLRLLPVRRKSTALVVETADMVEEKQEAKPLPRVARRGPQPLPIQPPRPPSPTNADDITMLRYRQQIAGGCIPPQQWQEKVKDFALDGLFFSIDEM